MKSARPVGIGAKVLVSVPSVAVKMRIVVCFPGLAG
jgi:hypothetical protein